MAQTPYSPMRAAEKLVSQEDMWAKLAKHAKAEVEIHFSKAGETPKAEAAVAPPPLVWLKPVRTGEKCGYVLTQCGRFSICKEEDHGLWYTAWLRKEPPHDSVMLGIRLTRREAEHLCELEAAK